MSQQWQPLSHAAAAAKVGRNAVARWVKEGLLESKKGRVRNLETTLVRVDQVKELAKQRPRGRPRQDPNP